MKRMKRLHRLLAAATLALALFAGGCMGQKEPEQAPEQKEGTEKKDDKKQEKNPVVQGADKMQSKLGDLRDALETGDPTEVRRQARQLDDTWEGFEQKVEAKNPDMYDQVETSLNIVLAGVQLVPINTKVMQAEMDRLDQKLDQLKETKGERPKPEQVDMETGAAAMRHGLTRLNDAAEAGDTAKMQEHATAVDRSWTQFEAEVKEQSKQDYEAIEDSLHSILAQVKASPVDKEKLKEETGKLDAKLEELTK